MSENGLASRVEGFVLVGGNSGRFGADKALAPIGGVPLLALALGALQAIGLRARVVAADPGSYAGLGGGAVSSERPGQGPAEGLRAALDACSTPWALVLATDMPGVDAALLVALTAALPPREVDALPGAAARAVCFGEASGRRHPLPGLYHRSLAADLARLPGKISLQRVLDEARARVLPVGPDAAARSLANINTRGDLVRFSSGAGPAREGDPDDSGPESD